MEESALDGDEVNINRLYLRVSDCTQIPTTGTHEIDFWIGEWDLANDSAGAELVRESFDVVGLNFVDGEVYEFEFSTPFSLDETKDYAFQVWWTTDDASHNIAWDRDTGQGNIDGGFISSKDKNLSLPFDANPANNTDLFFAFATIPEPSSAMLIMIGGLTGLLYRRRSI